ncbi:MAG TPA: hypothetical protein VGE67_12490 [Haloferula sp.]
MKALVVALSCTCLSACMELVSVVPDISRAPTEKLELVMAEGDRITATTSAGTVEIVAGKGLERTYTWEGASRHAKLWPRTERWDGSMGAYFPGPGQHWKSHHGVTRGVLEEGQQHFKRESEALAWLRRQSGYYATVYSKQGLVVTFDKSPDRRQINVEVAQIFIDGKVPGSLPGASHGKLQFQRAANP